jgi:hypothetical protein
VTNLQLNALDRDLEIIINDIKTTQVPWFFAPKASFGFCDASVSTNSNGHRQNISAIEFGDFIGD